MDDHVSTLPPAASQINRALRSFVGEMKAMGRWDDVAIFTKSEFGRTITSNGARARSRSSRDRAKIGPRSSLDRAAARRRPRARSVLR